MIKRNLYKIILILCIIITLILLLGQHTVFADEIIWSNDFTGTGSDFVTFRTYIALEVTDAETGEYLGMIEFEKLSGGSEIDGTYVLKQGNSTFLKYKNTGNECNLTVTRDYRNAFGQFLFTHPDVGGHEKYHIEAVITTKCYARAGARTVFAEWGSIDEAETDDFSVYIPGGSGAKSSFGGDLDGRYRLDEKSQIRNLREIYRTPWTDDIAAVGLDCVGTYYANGGYFSNDDVIWKEPFSTLDGCVGPSDDPTREGCYFWFWSTKSYGVDAGPRDKHQTTAGYILFDEIGSWNVDHDVELYAVWGI